VNCLSVSSRQGKNGQDEGRQEGEAHGDGLRQFSQAIILNQATTSRGWQVSSLTGTG